MISFGSQGTDSRFQVGYIYGIPNKDVYNVKIRNTHMKILNLYCMHQTTDTESNQNKNNFYYSELSLSLSISF